jgi:adenylyltransferase/sulfurtransferase
VRRDLSNPLNGANPSQTTLIDYEQFCGLNITQRSENSEVKEIDVFELHQLIENGDDFQLIDVREPYEYAIANINGNLFPLGNITEFAPKISRERKVVVHCRSGVRSAKAIRQLEQEFGFNNLYNLKGGILAYAKEVDQSLATY